MKYVWLLYKLTKNVHEMSLSEIKRVKYSTFTNSVNHNVYNIMLEINYTKESHLSLKPLMLLFLSFYMKPSCICW